MTHHKVDSSNVYSIGHEGDTMEIKFKCGKCCGTGIYHFGVSLFDQMNNGVKPPKCDKCEGTGHTDTYRYVGVPPSLYAKVATGEPATPGGKPSVGSAYYRLIRSTGQFKEEKVQAK